MTLYSVVNYLTRNSLYCFGDIPIQNLCNIPLEGGCFVLVAKKPCNVDLNQSQPHNSQNVRSSFVRSRNALLSSHYILDFKLHAQLPEHNALVAGPSPIRNIWVDASKLKFWTFEWHYFCTRLTQSKYCITFTILAFSLMIVFLFFHLGKKKLKISWFSYSRYGKKKCDVILHYLGTLHHKALRQVINIHVKEISRTFGWFWENQNLLKIIKLLLEW
jgi:hypothetical protein